jgi:hypothetical protein
MAMPKNLNLPILLGSSVVRPVALKQTLKPKRHRSALMVLVLCGAIGFSPTTLVAQSPSAQNASAEPDGITEVGYVVHSSLEFGYRSNNLTGSQDMYDTLVNLRTGPRLLDETLSMQSVDHQGFLFDDFYVNSFGWGGDRDNALRLRAEKDKWYNLQGSFRRDENFFDYDLLANPLNPPTSTPSIPVLNSPHEFDTTRCMSDVDLMLLPQSRVSFRLGYSHNNMTGPVYSSIHEGTEAFLLQPWNTTLNSYRVGVDWEFASRSVLSYDEFLDYYRGDTDTQLASFAPALLPNGTPVELGLSFDTANREPCGLAKGTTSLISAGVLTNVDCSGYFSYLRNQRIRTSTPTERAGLRSNYFRRVDLVVSFAYSDAEMNTPLYENFDGLMTRTFTRAFVGTGTADASRTSDNFDLGVTVHLNRHFRLIDKFYFWAYRIPQGGNFSETDNDCTNTKTCTLITPLSATAPTITPTAVFSSFNQSLKRNQTELAWDISSKVGASIGYRYGDRVFNDFPDFLPGDETSITVRENTALVGIWARPIHNLRLNFDLQDINYDNVIVRMAPRKESRYRFQAGYNPRPWAVFGGSINLLEDSNKNSLTNYLGHTRNYGLTAALSPRTQFGLDLAYNFNDVIQNALICFNDTPPTGVTLPFVSGATLCPGPPLVAPATAPSNPLSNDSYYTNHTQFGMATIRFKFDKRTMVEAGGSITNVDGSVPQFNILQPLGSAAYRYYQPVALLSVDLGHKLAWKSGWNYYQYNEFSFVGPTAPRYFHANNITESLRYAF